MAPVFPHLFFRVTSASASIFPISRSFRACFAPGYPPFFAYPPPADAQHPDGTQPAIPYPLLYPPGMIYAFPPPVPAAAPAAASAEASRPKRRQVKMACTNCATACKRCDEARPCERCKKYGVADTCVDGQRKERKKGIKRGPYKRKSKPSAEDQSDNLQTSESGDWTQGSSATPPSPSAAPAPSAASPSAPAPPQLPPEGFYPIYFPPGYPMQELQANPVGSTPAAAPTFVPIFIGGFAPYGYPPGAMFQLPPPGTHPPPTPAYQATTTEAGTVLAADKSSEADTDASDRSPVVRNGAEDSTNEDSRDKLGSVENANDASTPTTNSESSVAE
ncbi:hypothetical protein D9757_004179 [Collybiopsis confluens]|uniref:Zn(2)-C6 fungal-type domain-containing protein n=1 Tax=Collybiopsis confluens TaxID=2823264 RepID=A0A8H5HUC8_9AGAR|nr:hypothetical protein D9757_004179 [Collybiopsis confluens]